MFSTKNSTKTQKTYLDKFDKMNLMEPFFLYLCSYEIPVNFKFSDFEMSFELSTEKSFITQNSIKVVSRKLQVLHIHFVKNKPYKFCVFELSLSSAQKMFYNIGADAILYIMYIVSKSK